MSTHATPRVPDVPSKIVTLTVNDRSFDTEDCFVIASDLLLRWAADMGLIEMVLDDDGEPGYLPTVCCHHDCAG